MAEIDLLTQQLIAVRSFVVVAMPSIGLQVTASALAAGDGWSADHDAERGSS